MGHTVVQHGCPVCADSPPGMGYDALPTKIAAIIDRRLQTLSIVPKLEYKARRADGFQFTTDDSEQIVSEENYGSQRLTELVMTAYSPHGFSLTLDFDANSLFGRAVVLMVSGSDRDLVDLLSSELRSHIPSQVANVRPAPKWLAVALLFAAFWWAFFTLKSLRPEHPLFNKAEVLQSSDIQLKLNYLIQGEGGSYPIPLTLSLLSLELLCLIGCFYFAGSGNPQPFKYLMPRNMFLFGKGVKLYERRIGIRDRVIWTVIIGLVVSFIAGLIVWRVTPR